jgi:hypothetical protein
MGKPVFIIGSPRSGTSALTWSLGQHPNLYPLEETVWFGPLGREAEQAFELGSARGARSQLSAMGITRERFMRGLGNAIDAMIMEHRFRPADDVERKTSFTLIRRSKDPKERWVDGTPENSNCVEQLRALFPEASFIHLLREPELVIRSLGNFDRIGGEPQIADEACREWLRHVRACLAAESAMPAGRIMRLAHRDLAEDPKDAIRRCLSFLGEPWSKDCLKPLRHRINSSAPSTTDGDIPLDEALLAEVHSVCAESGLDLPRSMVPRRAARSEEAGCV